MKRCLQCEAVFESESWRCPACTASPAEIDGQLAFAPELAKSNDGYDPEAFAEVAGIEDEHFLRHARNRLFSWALRRYFPAASRYLEIGAGIGVILRAMQRANPQLEIWGSEIYSAGLTEISRNVPGIQVFQADAGRLPFRDEFDVVGAFDTLEHIEDDVAVLRELHAAIRPDGGILVSVPQHPFLWSQRDEAVRHKRRYTRAELISKVEVSGFEPLRVSSFVTLPFPAIWWSAIRNREAREGYDPFAEFKLGRGVNSVLNGVLSVERGLIESGVSFPFGGTLLLAARRV